MILTNRSLTMPSVVKEQGIELHNVEVTLNFAIPCCKDSVRILYPSSNQPRVSVCDSKLFHCHDKELQLNSEALQLQHKYI